LRESIRRDRGVSRREKRFRACRRGIPANTTRDTRSRVALAFRRLFFRGGGSSSGYHHRGRCFAAAFEQRRFSDCGWRATNRRRGTVVFSPWVIHTSGNLHLDQFASADGGVAGATAVENRPTPLSREHRRCGG